MEWGLETRGKEAEGICWLGRGLRGRISLRRQVEKGMVGELCFHGVGVPAC